MWSKRKQSIWIRVTVIAWISVSGLLFMIMQAGQSQSNIRFWGTDGNLSLALLAGTLASILAGIITRIVLHFSQDPPVDPKPDTR